MESYDEKSIKKAYQALGLKAGDVVYLTSSLAMMGRPPNTVKNSTDLCHLFYKPLIDIIGEEGTIIAPAFSYTFGKGSASEPAIFDPQLTSADTGLFPNFLLKQPKVKRTKDPMLSMAYLGGDISSLTQDLDNATYTDNSFLARLAKSKAKFINIGIGVGWLPFVHYIDWLLKSPYRYNKHFNGFIREGEQLKATSWLYSVRALIENSLPDTEEIGISAFNKGIWKKSKLGSKDIYCCNCQEYFEFALNEVKNTPWLVAKGPEVNPLDAEKKRTGEECHPLITSDFNSLVWLKYFKKLRRDLVSDSMSALFYSIEKYFPLNITRILSGEMVYGRAVPERWLLKQAWVKDRQGNVLINIENDDEDVVSYSLPVTRKIPRIELLKHIDFYNDKKIDKSTYNNRDWGFLCSKTNTRSFDDDEYQVLIDSSYSLGEMLYGELSIVRDSAQHILICCYTEGPNREHENLSGVIVGLQLYRDLLNAKKKVSVTILILPNITAFLHWFSKNTAFCMQVKAAYHLKFIDTQEAFFEQKFDTVDEEISFIFEASKPLVAFESVPLTFDNVILSGEKLTRSAIESARGRHTGGNEQGLQKARAYLLAKLA